MYETLCQPLNVEKQIRLYTGTGNPLLAQRIANVLHLELSGLKIEKFSNGEIYARFEETVRGSEVFFVQSIAGANVNDLLMETLIVATLRLLFPTMVMLVRIVRLPAASPLPPVLLQTCLKLPALIALLPSICTPVRFKASLTSR